MIPPALPRRVAACVLLVGTLAAGCDAGRRDHPAVGRAVAGLSLVPLGHEAEPPQLVGRVTLLNFWATWCPPCRQELPGLVRLAARLADDPRFQLVAVNVDSGDADAHEALADATGTFLRSRDLALRPWGFADALAQVTVSTALGVDGIPATFLVGPDGHVRRAWVGFRAGDEADMAREVVALLDAQPAAP